MVTVTLTKDMRPWREGDDVHLADDAARRLIDSGEAKDPRTFPEGKPLKVAAKPAPTYRTKDVSRG